MSFYNNIKRAIHITGLISFTFPATLADLRLRYDRLCVSVQKQIKEVITLAVLTGGK